MFSNFKIGVRLIASFLFVAAISGVVGFVGIFNAEKLNAMNDRLYEQELLGVSYIKEANINLIYIGRARANFVLATAADERERHLQNIAKYSATAQELVAKAQPLFRHEKAKEILASFGTNWAVYH